MWIPLVGFACVLVLVTALRLIIYDSFDWILEWPDGIGYNFTVYGSIALLVPATLLATLTIWTGGAGLRAISSLARRDRPARRLILFTLCFALVVSLLSPEKSGAELIFLMGPLAIVSNNYIEALEEVWFKELLLWITLLLSIGAVINVFL